MAIPWSREVLELEFLIKGVTNGGGSGFIVHLGFRVLHPAHAICL